MYINSDKTNENNSNAVANSIALQQDADHEGFQFKHSRPEAIAQRNIQETVNNSTSTKQLKAIKKLANNSAQAKQLRAVQSIADIKVLQHNGSQTQAAQLTPAMWKESDFITQVTDIAHGWFSTWKKIKTAITEYKLLSTDNIAGRSEKLTFIKQQIILWKADDDHKPTSTEKRVQDIIEALPKLEELIQVEENEIEEFKEVKSVLKGKDLQSIWDSDETGKNYDPLFTKYGINSSKKLYPFWGKNQRFTFMVPPQIIAGLIGDESAKVNTLFERINAFPFFYSGVYQPAEIGFLNKNGDCLTLALMLQLAASAAGINNVKVEKLVERHLVAKGPAHGRDKAGNVENEAYWTFRNHFWCTHNGSIYDLLFMKKALAKPDLYTGEDEYNGIKYELYEGSKFMIASDKHEAITKKQLTAGSQGIVFSSLVDLKLYIDTNK